MANAEKLHDEFISKPLQEVWPIDKEQEALSIFPMLGFAWAGNAAELRFLLFDYLWREMEFLSNQDRFEEPWIVRISPAGWEHLQKFGISNSNSGFVALWFDPTMDAPWQNGFLPAITEAGYSPVRIDKTEHNNKIDDEIIATIRGARFLVADFTGSRGGVYFEAGFAAGLGKPVIWTVREDYLDQLHFDTRQYNHISWHPNDLETFKASLRNRIEATLGRGTLRPQ